MAEKLTPQQRQAVENRGGRLLVSAAAGSGKTKVLVDRLMSYIMDPEHPANMDDFLLITYTKAAAAELRGKIASKLTEHIANGTGGRHLQRQLQRLYLTKISTVHAFCGDILREYACEANIPRDFRVGDENECAELRIAVVEQLLEQAYEKETAQSSFFAFVDSQGLGRNDSLVPEIILKVYDSAKCHLDPGKWLSQCLQLLDTEQITDASETMFGQFLIGRLHRWLDLQIEAFSQCVSMAENAEKYQKVAENLSATLYDLKRLRNCRLWDEVVAGGDVEFGRLVMPRNAPDGVLGERIKAVRNSCKAGLARQLRPFANPSGQVLADLSSCREAAVGLVDLVKAFDEAYTKAKTSRRILDFSDLEHKMLDLLRGKSRSVPTLLAREIGSRFREIMVDEYQDSNEVQDAIYSALSDRRNNLFMVGDVKQSIYQFRLADPGIFLEKYGAFAPADQAQSGQDRKVVLSRNFRSGGGVLAAANDVFRTCMTPEVGGLYYGADEALYEGIEHIPLGSPEAELYCIDVQEESYPEEAAFVAEKIRTMLDEGTPVRDGDALRPVRPEDIVLLLRSPNSCGYHFQRALERVGIRCNSGGTDLLQTEEIADLRCLLQAVHNPRLDIPLIGALASPIFGFTADDLAFIRSKNKYCSVYESLQQADTEKSRQFLQVLQTLRQAMREHSLTGLLEEIWIRTAMDDIYAAMENGKVRRENLQTFFQLAAEFESGGSGDLGRFLEYLDNMEEKGLLTTGDASGTGAVTIMSIHKSKGLEFPVVFLCSLHREFNTESQRANVLCHKEMGLGLSVIDRQQRVRYPSLAKRAIAAQMGCDGVSEEMRVLYVAMTRPKDRLIMTYASKFLQKELSEMVNRMHIGGNELLIREAVCPGEWILLTALQRSEAGELFALGGYPEKVTPGTPAWKIQVVQAPALSDTKQVEAQSEAVTPALLQRIALGISFDYAHTVATGQPSKQTATQRKGREKDREAAEHTPALSARVWREPRFRAPEQKGTEYGNAIHAVMQYVDYNACGDVSGIRREVQRLIRQQYITPEQGEMADCGKIAAFFATDIGKMLRAGAECVREFKFSILDEGIHYHPKLDAEQVLLQGVVDCALIEPDGITIIDFKTDYVTEETLPAVIQRYRPQVETYASAMERIYQKKIKAALLYFFRLDRFEAL